MAILQGDGCDNIHSRTGCSISRLALIRHVVSACQTTTHFATPYCSKSTMYPQRDTLAEPRPCSWCWPSSIGRGWRNTHGSTSRLVSCVSETNTCVVSQRVSSTRSRSPTHAGQRSAWTSRPNSRPQPTATMLYWASSIVSQNAHSSSRRPPTHRQNNRLNYSSTHISVTTFCPSQMSLTETVNSHHAFGAKSWCLRERSSI